MRPGSLAKRGPVVREAARGEPEDRVLHDLRLRRDRALQGHAEPRHRLRHVGRARSRSRSTRTASCVMPGARRHRHPRRAGVRRPRPSSPRSSRPGPPGRARRWTSPSPTRPPTSTGTASRPGRGTTGPRTRSTATRPTTTSGGPPAPPACRRASATRSTRPPTATCCSWPASRRSGRTSPRAIGRPDLFEKWPGSKYGDHARSNNELHGMLTRDLQDQDVGGVDRVRQHAQHADRRR